MGRFVTHFVAGMAIALSGAASGQVWEVGEQTVRGASTPQAAARWGAATVAADFDCDGFGDLVAAGPDYDYAPGSVDDSGVVYTYRGGPNGFVGHAGGFFFLEPFGFAGAALAAGDFDDSGCPELVIGQPGYDAGGEDRSGRVEIHAGSAGWTALWSWWQSQLGEADEPFDNFGEVLAVGNFNGDAYADLAVGVPGENLEGTPTKLDAGAVMVLYGSATGLTSSGAQRFTEDSGTLGGAQAGAGFGSALAAGDFDGDLYADLAVGIPGRDVTAGGLQLNAGEVVVLFGSAAGLTTSGHLRFDDADFGGVIAAGDNFGAALAAADFDLTFACLFLDCYVDLAIGIPGEPIQSQAGAGGVVVAYGSASGPSTSDWQFFSQENLVGPETPEPGDQFGSVLVAAGIDNRIGADLAIGVPEESGGGVVHLLFGGASKLVTYPTQTVVRHGGMTAYPASGGDRFGFAMAFADFDGNGHRDGAFGLPGFETSGVTDSGLVQILYGAVFADGFESGGRSLWSDSVP